MENSIQKRKGAVHGRYGSVIKKSLKARIQTMSFLTYINFQVNNTGGGRSNMVVHSHVVILTLLRLCPESFGIFYMGKDVVSSNGVTPTVKFSSSCLDYVVQQYPGPLPITTKRVIPW